MSFVFFPITDNYSHPLFCLLQILNSVLLSCRIHIKKKKKKLISSTCFKALFFPRDEKIFFIQGRNHL